MTLQPCIPGRQTLRSLLAVLLLACCLSPGSAQVPRLTAAAARIDPASVSVQTITPAEAYGLKQSHGLAVLLLDLRPLGEVAVAGTADGVDAIVPYAPDLASTRPDGSRTAELPSATAFTAAVEARVAALDGHHDTPLLLLCRDGQQAAIAARILTLAGFSRVQPITGGFEGEPDAQGVRRGGWKDSQPWHASRGDDLLPAARK